jgi:NAD(P)-dependent dehydrogenase (short-subunit alcohol dehydrogenase family)
MKNKIILITGGTGGIGKQTALTLAKMGAHVVVTGRSQASGEAAVSELKRLSGSQQVDLLLADISTQAGVRSLSDQFKAKYDRLDVLINNAGLAASARQLTEDGVESNFAVNAITPFLLTHLLMDRLKSSASARVINLTGGEAKGVIDLDNLQAERSFSGLNSYSHSKLVMMAMAYEFAQRVQGTNVTINVCYPGQAATNMTRSVTPEMLPGFMRFMWPFFKLAIREDGGKSAEKASRSSVYLASSVEVEGVNGKNFDTNSKMVDWPAAVVDQSTRQQIWKVAEQVSRLI